MSISSVNGNIGVYSMVHYEGYNNYFVVSQKSIIREGNLKNCGGIDTHFHNPYFLFWFLYF